jgi:hypothetical protein
MRTTLDIQDDVLAAAKELALRQRRSIGEVISALAKQALTAPAGTATRVSKPKTVYGFKPFPARGRIVTNDLIDRLRESVIL